MSHKRRHKATRKKIPAANFPAAEGPKAHPYGGREVRRDILIGALFIVIVLGVKHVIEHTTFGEQMKVLGYNFLQTRLSSESPPVTIVNITKLPPETVDIGGEKVTATSRKSLEQMIEAIAEHHPKAIGVDIDFSPDEGNYILPTDPDFFQFCLDLQEKKDVPVFLGVNRTIANPAAEWLGDKKFEPLAANILIPRDSRRMLNVLRVGDGKVKGYKPSRSMSALLADAYGEGEISAVGQWIHGLLIHFNLVKKFSNEELDSDLSVKDFLVDYGSLASLESERIKKIDHVDLKDSRNRKTFENRIVLIGDATLGEAADTFVVPVRNEPVPGIFLHASAAYTLIKAPLYDLTEAGHILLDILLAGIVLLGVVLIKYRYNDAEQRDVAAKKWRGRLTLLIVLAAVVVGVVFVRITRIMWDDFFLALLLLVFHPSIEHHAETLWTKIKGAFRSKDRLAASCWPLILTAFVFVNCCPGVIAQDHPAGIIESISGTVFLKQNGKQLRLNSKTDIARRLYPGDSIRCTKGAKATVMIGGKKTDLDEKLNWFVIPNTISSRSDSAQRAINEYGRAIDRYGRIGGRNRRSEHKTILFSPPDESVVAPESFIIRWVPARKNCLATIEIQHLGSEVLWQEKNVDSASGELNSQLARQALESYRSRTDADTLRLKLNDSCGNSDQSDFTVLSVAEENSLKQDLKFWDRDSESLMNHLGRAAVFNQYRMFFHVAEEYEQALVMAPRSRDLLLRTIEAQRLIGNLVRVKELQRRQAGRK
jgi:CHASE2 domain-containing sensor protein